MKEVSLTEETVKALLDYFDQVSMPSSLRTRLCRGLQSDLARAEDPPAEAAQARRQCSCYQNSWRWWPGEPGGGGARWQRLYHDHSDNCPSGVCDACGDILGADGIARKAEAPSSDEPPAPEDCPHYRIPTTGVGGPRGCMAHPDGKRRRCPYDFLDSRQRCVARALAADRDALRERAAKDNAAILSEIAVVQRLSRERNDLETRLAEAERQRDKAQAKLRGCFVLAPRREGEMPWPKWLRQFVNMPFLVPTTRRCFATIADAIAAGPPTR